MKINISKKQYRKLVFAIGITDHVLGILGDSLPESDYKQRSNTFIETKNYFLQFAKDFHAEDMVDEFDGQNVINDGTFLRLLMPVMNDYDEEHFYSSLMNKLAWRDFKKDHSEEEIAEMAKENNGYFGVALHPYEQKYWKEFNEHGLGRLELENK